MIHVRIDNRHSTAVDIYVNIAPPTMITSSSPIPSPDEHVYDRLFDTETFTPRQSKVVKSRLDSNSSFNKKNYTLQQILDNVETIQNQYEQVVTQRTTSTSTPSCFFTFKQITKLLKNLRTMKNKTPEQASVPLESHSPFTFGGETLQWIALPRDDSHIYENELLH